MNAEIILQRVVILLFMIGFFVYALSQYALAYTTEGFPRKGLIQEIKAFEKRTGFTKDENFHVFEPSLEAYYICYSTGLFTLPDTYRDPTLAITAGTKNGCNIDTSVNDVVLSRVEAVGNIKTPVTQALLNAKLERFISVVFHEDYHEEIPNVPIDVNEAATTMMGLALAIDFAREKYGEDSPIYKNLLREPELYLQKAEYTNRCFRELKILYNSNISREEKLRRKEKIFHDLQRHCARIAPTPTTFNPLPLKFNNAGLALDMTYTRHFPRMYAAWVASDKNAKKLFETLKKDLQ